MAICWIRGIKLGSGTLVLDLILRGASCASGLRGLLMTASPRGAVYSTLEVGLDKMGVSAGSVTLLPCESYERFCPTSLWEVVEQPHGWDKLSQHSMVCKALILMTEWLRLHQHQTAVILIFVAGETEVRRMRNAILMSAELNKVHWAWDAMSWRPMPSEPC